MDILVAGGTDIGRKRDHNEDSLGLFPEAGLVVVADGMGGHAAGELASSIAVETIGDFVKATAGREDITWPFRLDESLSRGANMLCVGIKLANSAVLGQAATSPGLKGMGTTVVAALVEKDRVHIAHVGDSRAYLLSGGAFSRLTVDHSFVEEQVAAGLLTPERARTHSMKNIITRALGIKEPMEVALSSRTPAPGDVYLLCTDGLSNMLEDSVMGRMLMDCGPDLDRAVEKLITAANESGGDDNITVALLKVS